MRSSHPTRGFAATFAIFMIALVAGAMLAVTTLMRTDARRTTDAAIAAQLRQLLHAGAIEASRRRATDGVLDVRLPSHLSDSGASLRITPRLSQDRQTLDAIIEARFAEHEAAQTLRFQRDGDHWHFVAVELR